jgi:hypothetical protein
MRIWYGLIWLRIRHRSMSFSNGSETEAFISGIIIIIII